MPIVEEVKRIFEKLTGLGRPSATDAPGLVRIRKAHLATFRDDGETPNNPRLPLIYYRGAVQLDASYDPAGVFEVLFAAHGWSDSWRNGVYDFLHFHSAAHEVLGIARGRARVRFGGARGRVLALRAGDVVIVPAGVGHQRVEASDDLLVVGAYPENCGRSNHSKPEETDLETARAEIARVNLPRQDPVYGTEGPLRQHWKAGVSRLARALSRSRERKRAAGTAVRGKPAPAAKAAGGRRKTTSTRARQG